MPKKTERLHVRYLWITPAVKRESVIYCYDIKDSIVIKQNAHNKIKNSQNCVVESNVL